MNLLEMNHVKKSFGNYLSSVGLSGGPSECTLKAKSIDFRFVQDTVEVLGLECRNVELLEG